MKRLGKRCGFKHLGFKHRGFGSLVKCLRRFFVTCFSFCLSSYSAHGLNSGNIRKSLCKINYT